MDREMLRKINHWLHAALSCFALSAALNTDLSAICEEAAAGGFWNLLAANIKKLEYLLPVFSYREALFCFFVLFFYGKTENRQAEGLPRLAIRLPAGLTAFFLLFGYSFRYTNSWDLVFMDSFHLLVSGLMLLGFYFLFERLYDLLIGWLLRQADLAGQPWQGGLGRAVCWVFEEHAFLGPCLVILAFWTPYLLAKFPGAAMPETLAEMRQFYWQSINNYYPPFHTVSLSLIMELGGLFGSYTLGFFLNLVLQLSLLLCAFSYGFVLMKRWRTPYLLRCLALGIICIVEFFPMEATIVEKDVPYTACVLFLVLLLFELVRTMEAGKPCSWKKLLGIVLACLGVACNRNEGFFLILASGICLGAYAHRRLWRADRAGCLRVLLAAILPILLFALYQKALLPALGVEDNGPKEALSIPFQQTARYVRDYGYELTEEEEEILSQVLDYENLAELYDPITSDPVKYTYHAESAHDLAAYFGLWFRQLIRHPGNAVEATMNNAYGWFYQEGYAQNYMMDSQIEGHEVRWEIAQPARLAGIRQVMERVAKLLSRVPIINWFENAGFASWMTFLLFAVWLGARKREYLLSGVPLFMALLVCIAAPTFNYQMRYIMPVLFCVPFYGPMAAYSLSSSSLQQVECGARACRAGVSERE